MSRNLCHFQVRVQTMRLRAARVVRDNEFEKASRTITPTTSVTVFQLEVTGSKLVKAVGYATHHNPDVLNEWAAKHHWQFRAMEFQTADMELYYVYKYDVLK